ncbi:MAG: FAD-dependent oxidoreductase [Tepidimonas sp.]|uniref:NAD(P)/FAD-dependent oxidoreductase n=1 Tax=Tepidimonas sp. TaxID=2002775 RepID=UPI00298EF1C5|nr:FAD-dependent oxidoreductase [Tepidimonas sp.]MDW8335761.1 FAD-dependent oxidoreductase [Tepidimonas sp.]
MPRPDRPLSHRPRPPRARLAGPLPTVARLARVAVVGAGMAGLSAARTLSNAGLAVTVLERSPWPGGRMATRPTPVGDFDHGAQFFTVRDARLEHALRTTQAPVQPWRARFVRVLSADGQQIGALPADGETRWLPLPAMQTLAAHWAQQWLHEHRTARVRWGARVQRVQRQADGWYLHGLDGAGGIVCDGPHDAVLLALPAPTAADLLANSGLAKDWQARLQEEVSIAPCWALMVGWPHGSARLGPAWDAARCLHPQLAWVAREGSKPGREGAQRWVAQAQPDWSAQHLQDEPQRIGDQLLRALADVTGLRAEPALLQVHRWRHAQTRRALGEPYLWDAALGLGVCGDWCLGHRVEHAFVSGLELALAVAGVSPR